MLIDRYGNPIEIEQKFPHIAAKTRLTKDVDEPISAGYSAVVAPTDDADWKLRHFTEAQLAAMKVEEILSVLVDASPDLDRALSDVRMHVNTEFTWNIVGNNEAAKTILQNAIDKMRMENGEPLGVKLDKLVSSGYLKGAFYLETTFQDTEFVDIVINDPLKVRFVRDENEERGQFWLRGEEHDGEFVPINSPTVQYIPLNSVENKPYGRSMVSSAIYPIVSLLGLMKSARQTVETQAFPYQVATIDRQKLVDVGLTAQSGELKKEIERIEKSIRNQFENATKGTQFVFGNEVEIEIIGALARRNLDGLEMLESIFKRWIIQALKQYPVLFGLSEGNALSTNADQQLEAWATFIDTFQTHIEALMTTVFTQILREQGNPANVVFELKRNTSFVQKQRAERLKLKSEVVQMWLQMGIITRQKALEIIRSPEAFDKLSKILEPELDPELEALPLPGAPPEPASEPASTSEE